MCRRPRILSLTNDPATTANSTLSLHDALPIYRNRGPGACRNRGVAAAVGEECPFVSFLDSDDVADLQRVEAAREIFRTRSEEHTSELQSHSELVWRLLLEKKNT